MNLEGCIPFRELYPLFSKMKVRELAETAGKFEIFIIILSTIWKMWNLDE